jgi:hypothetical protein
VTTEAWGVVVSLVELKDIQLPDSTLQELTGFLTREAAAVPAAAPTPAGPSTALDHDTQSQLAMRG